MNLASKCLNVSVAQSWWFSCSYKVLTSKTSAFWMYGCHLLPEQDMISENHCVDAGVEMSSVLAKY